MKKLLIALCLLPLAAMGQEIKFDTQDYKSVGVYDRWEHSPFRTGELAGNCEVVDNPDLTNDDQLGHTVEPIIESKEKSST